VGAGLQRSCCRRRRRKGVEGVHIQWVLMTRGFETDEETKGHAHTRTGHKRLRLRKNKNCY
jgi:hypothetical protein